MAAPSQQSPNQASKSKSIIPDETNTNSNKAEELKDQPQPVKEEGEEILTYETTESSDAYLLAKRLLNEGDFESVLEATGTAMAMTVSKLPQEGADLHEAMAPLYYLYGTTLLYSIEESASLHATPAAPSEEPEDSQIAWENLEAARGIVEKLLTTKPSEKLRLDLAQIHLRLGDLQKNNGRYHDAVSDYSKCLEVRMPILGMYHRKVADTFYNLALVHMSLASEGDKKDQKEVIQMSNELREEYRAKALSNYLAAGKSFAGRIAFLCGESPESITAEATEQEKGGKTSGMDEADLKVNATSLALKTIRSRVAKLQSESDADTVFDLKEILDEIQETIDEAEAASKAIGIVSEMAQNAKAAAEGKEVANGDGSTTTVGFGTTEASAKVAATPLQPTLVVRKKKRPSDDQKPPAKKPKPTE